MSSTGSCSPTILVRSLPERGLLLLMVLVLLEGTMLTLGAASSPDVMHQENTGGHKEADQGHNLTKKAFPVLGVDYHHIQKPFEISLWVLLASLMKLGEYHVDVCMCVCALFQLQPFQEMLALSYVSVGLCCRRSCNSGVATSAGKLALLPPNAQLSANQTWQSGFYKAALLIKITCWARLGWTVNL